MKNEILSSNAPNSPERKKKKEDSINGFTDKKISRRDILRLTGVGGLGLLLGGGGIGSIIAARAASTSITPPASADTLPFYGEHQAGILTPAQNFLCFAAFDLTTTNLAEVKKLFQSWTTAAASLTSGQLIGSLNDHPNLPPTDTGEADGLSPSRCTLTFGVGPSFFGGSAGK